MEGYPSQLLHPSSVSIGTSSSDRFPQWSTQETREFLIIRAEFDQTFMETKRNKLLWEVISTKMKEKGYNRSAEQCKCKWKNLVTRYKGSETMESEAMRQQFPFYNELQAIFAARMERMLWKEAEGGSSAKKRVQLSSDDEEDNEEIIEVKKGRGKKKRKLNDSTNAVGSSSSGNVVNSIREMMEEFMQQQMRIDMQWQKAFERREEDRNMKEMEWRQTMQALENERLMLERKWREREEQRRIREEARAEKRDALVTALLNKLRSSI